VAVMMVMPGPMPTKAVATIRSTAPPWTTSPCSTTPTFRNPTSSRSLRTTMPTTRTRTAASVLCWRRRIRRSSSSSSETQSQSQAQLSQSESELLESQSELPETQPETEQQQLLLPETQEEPLSVQQQSQSQSPEAEAEAESQMDTQHTWLESQPETQQEDGEGEEAEAMRLGQDSQDSGQENDDEEEEEEEELLPDTQDQTAPGDAHAAAAAVPMDVDATTPASAEQEVASSPKRRRKGDTTGKKQKSGKSSLSDRRKILHESQTRGAANAVGQINLRVHTVNLGLCRVVAAWPLRKTKRLIWQTDTAAAAAAAAAAANTDTDGTPAPLPAKRMGGLRILSSPYGDFEDDGPLGNIYRSVLSLEVDEVVDEEREEALREQRRLFQRPFETLSDDRDDEDGDNKTKDSADKAAVLTAKTKRRIRVFLYGKYAAKVSRLLSEWKYRQPNSKACALAGEGREEILLSLNNVPARCVFPYYGRTSIELKAPVLDNELGRCSRYCLCIGSASHMMVTSDDAEDEKERFDTVNSVGRAADLEARIVMVRRATAVPNVGSPSRVEIEETAARKRAAGPTFKSTTESILSVSAIERKETEGPGPNASDLAARYGEIIRKKEKRIQQLIDEPRGEGSRNDQNEKANGTQRGEVGGGKDSGGQADASGAGPDGGTAGEQARKRRRTSVRYHTMAELQPFLDAIKAKRQDMQTGRRPYHRFDDSTNIYGIALSSSAPYRTKKGDWMVNIHLIDESLPPTKIVNDSNENNSNADNTPGNPSARGGAIHVPSISMNVFNADKAKLPVIRYAGDVIRAHRVAVQEYNGEIQLVGRRNSSFYVVRPRNETQMLQNPQGQGLIESYTASKPSILDVDDYMRMRDLWRWGRKRFSEHPTLHAKDRFVIADMGPSDDGERAMAGVPIERTINNGDLIAMVTAIIPQPPEQVSDRTPRAFLRLWDGTGRPESDPIPVNGLIARQATQDPPASVLTAINKIVPTLTKVGSEDEDEDIENFDPPKCLCGRVVNVAIWEAAQWERIRSNESGIRVGKFVRLKNVNDGRLGTANPKRCLMVHQKTSIVPIPDQTFEVNSILRAHNARILKKDPPNPSSGILPLTVPEDGDPSVDAGPAGANVPSGESIGQGSSAAAVAEPQVAEPVFQATSTSLDELFTLAEVIGGPDETEPATFKSRFTVYGTIPAVDLESGDGFKDLCVAVDPDDEASKELAYEFSLSIRDDSAEINVIVLNDVAETFFMSVTASDVCKKGGTRGGRRRAPEFNQGIKDLKAILAEDALWEGEIYTTILENEKYFVLKSLTRVNGGDGTGF